LKKQADIGAAKGPGGIAEYKLTAAGEDLREVIMSLAFGANWINRRSRSRSHPSLLMWDMRRNFSRTVNARCNSSIQNSPPGATHGGW
jgi:hypothetical protein